MLAVITLESHLDIAGVIDPGHAKHDLALGLDQALHHGQQLRPLLEDRLHGRQDLLCVAID
jgi:hypothetical protein